MRNHLFIGIALVAAMSIAPSWHVRAQSASVPAAAPESPIGKVVTVSGSVTVEHAVAVVLQANLPSGAAQATAGDFIYRNDVIQTGADGKLGIVFTDGTAFNISKNARMVLNEFVYDPKGHSNSTLISLTKGTFTFVAGQVAKTGDMKVTTPVGTMGIRGTTPRVEISEDGSVKFSTLVEEKKTTGAVPSSGIQQNRRPARQRQGSVSPPPMTPEQTARYNRLLDFDAQLCRGC
jgi:hypothetical protein